LKGADTQTVKIGMIYYWLAASVNKKLLSLMFVSQFFWAYFCWYCPICRKWNTV